MHWKEVPTPQLSYVHMCTQTQTDCSGNSDHNIDLRDKSVSHDDNNELLSGAMLFGLEKKIIFNKFILDDSQNTLEFVEPVYMMMLNLISCLLFLDKTETAAAHMKSQE